MPLSSVPSGADAERNTWRNRGIVRAEAPPRMFGWTGTSRQPSSVAPSSAKMRAIWSSPSGRGRTVLGKEADAGGVGPLGWQIEVDHGPAEGIGDLDEDAGTITGIRVRADGAPVLELAQRTQARLDDLVTPAPPKVHDEN